MSSKGASDFREDNTAQEVIMSLLCSEVLLLLCAFVVELVSATVIPVILRFPSFLSFPVSHDGNGRDDQDS